MTTPGGRPDLRAATLAGVRWISLARLVAEATAFASVVVLARVIPPAEFGRAAVAMIIVALAVILGPAGLTAPLVQRPSLESIHTEAATFLSLASGLLLTLLTFTFGARAGDGLFGSDTARLIELAAPAWLIVAVGAVPLALLQRELRFRRLAFVESTSVLVGAAVAVPLALLGIDGEAIIAGGLAAACAGTTVAVVSAPRFPPLPSRRGLAEVGSFALPVTLSSLFYATFRNVDYAILGARMSAPDVGFYWRAYQLGVDYQAKASQVMLRVSFPIFSRASDLDELRRLRMRIVRVHATVLLPLIAAFVAFAPVLIPSLFGPAWEPAVVPAQILAVAGMADTIMTGTGPLLIALGRPKVLLLWNACELAVFAALIFALAPYGLTAVSLGVAGFGATSVLLNWILLMRPVVGLSVAQLALEVVPGLVVGATVVVVLSALRFVLEGAELPTVLLLGALTVVAIVVYVVVLRFFFASVWRDLVLIVRRVRGSGTASVPDDAAGTPMLGS